MRELGREMRADKRGLYPHWQQSRYYIVVTELSTSNLADDLGDCRTEPGPPHQVIPPTAYRRRLRQSGVTAGLGISYVLYTQRPHHRRTFGTVILHVS